MTSYTNYKGPFPLLVQWIGFNHQGKHSPYSDVTNSSRYLKYTHPHLLFHLIQSTLKNMKNNKIERTFFFVLFSYQHASHQSQQIYNLFL